MLGNTTSLKISQKQTQQPKRSEGERKGTRLRDSDSDAVMK